MNTLLSEDYGVSKEWVFIIHKRQDSDAALILEEARGPSAQDRYCARSLGGGAKKRCGIREE